MMYDVLNFSFSKINILMKGLSNCGSRSTPHGLAEFSRIILSIFVSNQSFYRPVGLNINAL